MKRNLTFLLLIIILFFAAVLRLYALGEVPTGLHADEASQAYNAFSLLKTGKDMYGKSFPILFRANGSYQPPVYTYLTTIPVLLFGNTVFSARFISAVSGIFLVFLTFIFVRSIGFGTEEDRNKQALLSALVIAITPWAIHFSRLSVEGNLAVSFFAGSIVLFALSLKKNNFFIPACFLLGLSTHVYYSERVTAVLFLPVFVFVFRKEFSKSWKKVVLGLLIFAIVLLPHLFILRTGALTKRLSQVSYISDVTQRTATVPQKILSLTGEFLDHYLYYYSPKNLFFDSGQELGRTSIGLSVFYPWFIIPLLVGVSMLLKRVNEPLVKMLAMILLLAPVSAGLTGDLFYPLRVLGLLWALTIVISFGTYYIWESVKNKPVKLLIFFGAVIYSVFVFYTSYFIFSRYENVNDMGYSYIKMMDVLNNYKDKKIVIDNSPRAWGVGIRYTYLYKVDPRVTQKNLESQLITPYYSSDLDAYDTYTIDNIIVKPIDWGDDCKKDLILVGDRLSFSEYQIEQHKLKQIFTINNMNEDATLFGYITTKVCKSI
jgi:4-amino-4-deoxy-L-arabinose transferase-like glycosyltransferase